MCPFVEKKRKSVVFNSTISTEKPPTLFFNPVQPPYYSNPAYHYSNPAYPIITNYYNIQPPPPLCSILHIETDISVNETSRDILNEMLSLKNFIEKLRAKLWCQLYSIDQIMGNLLVL